LLPRPTMQNADTINIYVIKVKCRNQVFSQSIQRVLAEAVKNLRTLE
jgi:hypothetical protein